MDSVNCFNQRDILTVLALILCFPCNFQSRHPKFCFVLIRLLELLITNAIIASNRFPVSTIVCANNAGSVESNVSIRRTFDDITE